MSTPYTFPKARVIESMPFRLATTVLILVGLSAFLRDKFHQEIAVSYLILAFFLVWASLVDITSMMIPDFCSIGGLIAGLLVSTIVPSLHGQEQNTLGLLSSLQGALIGSGLLLWIAVFAGLLLGKEAVGFGDIKLMGSIGAFCGCNGAVFAIFGGSLLGAVGLLLWAIGSRKKIDSKHIPFAPFLAIGAIVYILIF